MRWDLFFEDLEGQLASEWEAERAALETEAERLRLSRVELRTRLGALFTAAREGAPAPTVEVSDGTIVSGALEALGADWVALTPCEGSAHAGVTIVPLPAIVSLTMDHADVLRSARSAPPRAGLTDRMTLGFVLRDLARRRVALSLALASGRTLTGTVDRAGADHLDLALHDIGAPRRASEVRGYRLVPFTAIAWLRVDQGGGMPGT